MKKILNGTSNFKTLIGILWSGAALSVSVRSYADGYIGFAIFNFVVMSIIAYILFKNVDTLQEVSLFLAICAKKGLSDPQLVEAFKEYKKTNNND